MNSKDKAIMTSLYLIVFVFFYNFNLLALTFINHEVPFTSQAPLGEWDDPRQQDACEEAVVLMSMAWVNRRSYFSRDEWRQKILELADFQMDRYGEHRDTSLEDIIDRMYFDYFSYKNVRVENVFSVQDIINEIEKGNIVLLPTNGQELKNPNFKNPGPERHMVLVKGYDYKKKQFITNDPGTRNGADYYYEEDLLFNEIIYYKSLYQETFN